MVIGPTGPGTGSANVDRAVDRTRQFSWNKFPTKNHFLRIEREYRNGINFVFIDSMKLYEEIT